MASLMEWPVELNGDYRVLEAAIERSLKTVRTFAQACGSIYKPGLGPPMCRSDAHYRQHVQCEAAHANHS